METAASIAGAGASPAKSSLAVAEMDPARLKRHIRNLSALEKVPKWEVLHDIAVGAFPRGTKRAIASTCACPASVNSELVGFFLMHCIRSVCQEMRPWVHGFACELLIWVLSITR